MEARYIKVSFNWPEEKSFENANGPTDDGRQSMPMLEAHLVSLNA